MTPPPSGAAPTGGGEAELRRGTAYAFLAYGIGLMLAVLIPGLLIGLLGLISPILGTLPAIALPAIFIPVVLSMAQRLGRTVGALP